MNFRHLAVGTLLALAGAAPALAQQPVKIGVITTLSGPNGYIGQDIRDALDRTSCRSAIAP